MLFSNLLLKLLRDQKKALLWWGVGLTLFNSVQMPFYPAMRAGSQDLNAVFQDMPDELLKAFVGNVTDFTSPAGFLYSQYFFMMLPLMFLVYAIGNGASAIAKEEEQGTLEMLVALPVQRWQIVLEKFGALAVGAMFLHVVFFVQLIISMQMVGMELSFVKVWQAVLANYGLVMFFGAFALLLGAATGRRSFSIALATAIAVGTNLLNSLGLAVDSIKPYRGYSPWYYMTESDPLIKGLDPIHLALLLAGAAVFLVAAMVMFQKRDIGRA